MINKLLWKLLCLLAMCAAIVFVALFLAIDIFIMDNISEISVVETIQGISLIAIFLSYFHFVNVDKQNSSLWILSGGFFACMFIRELDAFFDVAFYHGSWKIPAILLAFVSIFYAFKRQSIQTIGNSLLDFIKTPQFGLMLGGLLCIIIFSRFIGMRIMWEFIGVEQTITFAKSIAEESCELFGYMLVLLATIWLGLERNFFKFKD
ncbi:MAG: hypothetical protein IJ211_03845 [Campylobacter sp.]|nr:hypothetical protein [Campylobacter sp.]